MTQLATDQNPHFTDRPFTPALARQAGIDRVQLDRWCRQGTVVRLLRGAYLGGHQQVNTAARAEAIRLVAGRAVACGLTAAWLHGCSPDSLGLEPGEPVPLETAEPGALRLRDHTRVHGTLTQTAASAAVLLVHRLDPAAALAVLDGMLHGGALSPGTLLAALPGHETAARADGRAADATESRLRSHWLDGRLPTPVPAHPVDGARIALALPLQRFGVTLEDDPADRARWKSAEWGVVRISAASVRHARPEQVRQHLEREFHQHLLEEGLRSSGLSSWGPT